MDICNNTAMGVLAKGNNISQVNVHISYFTSKNYCMISAEWKSYVLP
jgi:hypothetical protein